MPENIQRPVGALVAGVAVICVIILLTGCTQVMPTATPMPTSTPDAIATINAIPLGTVNAILDQNGLPTRTPPDVPTSMPTVIPPTMEALPTPMPTPEPTATVIPKLYPDMAVCFDMTDAAELGGQASASLAEHSGFAAEREELWEDPFWQSVSSDVRSAFERAANAYQAIDVPDSEPEMARIVGEMVIALKETGHRYEQGVRNMDLELIDQAAGHLLRVGELARDLHPIIIDYCAGG